MDKNVSIVLSKTTKNYRKIAQENWGLSDEQMVNMDVHHFPPVSEGGRNIPEHLYVCSSYVHTYWWHNEDQFVLWARRGAKKAHELKNEEGKSVLAIKAGLTNTQEKLPDGRSKNAVNAGLVASYILKNDPVKRERQKTASSKASKKLHQEKDENGKSKIATKIGSIPHQEKTEDGRSKHAIKIAKASHQKKDKFGRSLKVMDMNKKVHNEKDELGRSLHTVKYLLQYNEPRKKKILDRKSTRLNSSHVSESRMPSSA